MKKTKNIVILGLVFSLIFGSLNIFVPNVYANELVQEENFNFIEEDNELGGIYYYFDNELGVQSRAIWDFVDVAMAGASWYDLIKDPSFKNLGWALLDTAAIAPLIPSSAYVRKGSKYVITTSSIKKLAATTSGKNAIRRALTTVVKSSLSSSDLNKALTLGRKYKLTESQYINHIVKRHGMYSNLPDKSKFLSNSSIKSLINSTLKDSTKIMKNTDGRAGYIYIKKFSSPVGIDKNGKKVYQVKVVLDSNGYVVTAFPYN